ncbi:MAG: hypothetical protein JJU20_09970 [Opitutales bacterium]|nr:hypothetical protein [Opitutales bacterium]
MFRTNTLNFLGLAAAVAIVAVLSCLVVFYTFLRPQMAASHYPGTFVEQLQLTEDQEATVKTIEADYEMERTQLLDEFEAATKVLAELLMNEDHYSDKVIEAIYGVHHVHGKLQSLSVERYFAILQVLPEDRQAELRRLASEALSHPE